MRRRWTAGVLTLGLLTAGFGAAAASLSQGDRHFLQEAGQDNLGEIQLGRLAAKRSDNAGVKRLGERLMHDHAQANRKLMTVVNQHGLSLPESQPQSTKDLEQELSGLSGAAFDRAFVDSIVRLHRHDVQTFHEQARHADNAEVRAFAQEVAPTLESHLREAERLQRQLQQSRP